MNLIQKLNKIQTELNAPKDAYNSFGKYKYRSAESILQAVKPLLSETQLVLMIQDEIVEVGGRVYVKATAQITDGENSVQASAFAREPDEKKGSDASQITGAASSYARKYALCGLLAIDDNKDADSTNTHNEPAPKREAFNVEKAIAAINNAPDLVTLEKYQTNALKRAENDKEKQAINQASSNRFKELATRESEE